MENLFCLMKPKKGMIQIYIQRLCHQAIYIGQLNLTVVNGLVHHTRNGKNSKLKNPPKKDDETHKDQIIADLSLELLKTQEELKDVRKDISDLTIQLLGGTTNA